MEIRHFNFPLRNYFTVYVLEKRVSMMFRYQPIIKVLLFLWVCTVISLELYKNVNQGKRDQELRFHTQSIIPSREAAQILPSSQNGSDSQGNEVYKVPNIVHYIWYHDRTQDLRFDQSLSVLSAVKYIKPDAIYLHTNNEPSGQFYDMIKNISILKVIQREPPVGQVEPFFKTTYSDYDRLKILWESGGIYLDFDVMATDSFDDLRKYRCTIGYEKPGRISGGIVICAKEEPFLRLWIEGYHEDSRPFWAYNSGGVPHKLAVENPNLIHTEETRLNTPNCKQLEKIWGNELYPWRQNYAIHTWIRMLIHYKRTLPTPASIKTMNSTYGEMARDILYGSTDILNVSLE